MKKVNIDLIGVSKEVIVEYLMNNYNGVEGIGLNDCFNESGIWEIMIGSRGYIEFVEKDDEYESFEEMYKLDDCEDEERKEVLEYIEEFCYEGESEIDDIGINCWEVYWSEEEVSVFVKIV